MIFIGIFWLCVVAFLVWAVYILGSSLKYDEDFLYEKLPTIFGIIFCSAGAIVFLEMAVAVFSQIE